MNNEQILNTLSFIKSVESLKNVLRSAHTSSGRKESTAEHTWRLCLLATVFGKELGNVDMAKLLKICIIHDLGEAISGDVPATEQTMGNERAKQERHDLQTLIEELPAEIKSELLALWDEYEQGSSLEGRIVKGLDKLETIIQHNQGENAPTFDYQFNLTYGADRMLAHPLLGKIRAIVDVETQAKIDEQKAQ